MFSTRFGFLTWLFFVPIEISKKEKKKLKRLRRPLTDTEKALAQKLIQSAKSRRELLEWNFHRFRFFEDESTLPDWFVRDEKIHMRKKPAAEDVSPMPHSETRY